MIKPPSFDGYFGSLPYFAWPGMGPYLVPLVMLFALTLSGQAGAACAPAVGQFVDIHGRVEAQVEDDGSWITASLETSLCEGSSIRVGEQSRAAIALINDAVLRLDENTTMRLVDIGGPDQEEERSFLDIIKGAIQSFSRRPRKLSINSPYLNGSIEGTEFVFRVTDEQSEITVFEGTVVAANDQGSVTVSGGEAASAGQGQAPQARTVVRPREAAQWSLYYPPVLATGGSAAGVSSALQQAAADLSAGRVDEARPKLDQAIAEASDAGLAYALRAVINVVQNRLDEALADANQGVALNPDNAATYVALSYVRQAGFQIVAARDTLLQAVTQQPEAALAWARLAELQLMLGDKQQAAAAARRAEALAPNLGRTQITLGFTALAEFRADDAKAAFGKAIALDSADPLPHLGLGLARISGGELEQGRADIEVAVALGSSDALLRAYLGKAYFEEKRAPLDNQQFEIAKQLDPNDPTAWLYSGIAKQTQNRPVEAAQDLQQSIALNDNRATYRGRLLLDKDRAARGSSLARVFKDLGFNQTGIAESTKSLGADPANASAHRFLSDSYRETSRRTEISRVSELLQAQMLQDLNINPVQPSISATNLNIVTAGGPSAAGFNEFTPLFEQNRTQVNAGAMVGNNETKGGEAVISTVYDRFSISGGAFDFETDGFRPNNDTSHQISGLFAQWAVSPTVNLQAEVDRRETGYGDIAMHFDPDDFDSTFRRTLDVDSERVGMRIAPSNNSTILVSVIRADRDGFAHEEQALDFGGGFILDIAADGLLDEEVTQYDVAYIYQQSGFNITTGIAYTESDRLDTITFADVPVFLFDDLETEQIDLEDTRVYAYGNITFSPGVVATVGLSYQDFDQVQAYNYTDQTGFLPPSSAEFDLDFDEVNPKLGIRAEVMDNLELRASYFEVVKPALSSNRTLEPTQVAGFNQFFDDPNGTRSKSYGLALDGKTSPTLRYGVEFTRREIEGLVSPLGAEPFFEDRKEWLHRAYAYWTPADSLAVDFSLEYDRSENQDESAVSDVRPTKVDTYSFPVSIRYFHAGGAFVGVTTTYVDQEVEAESDYKYQTGSSNFTLVDLVVGYRLPQRKGIMSLSFQNLFDEEFEYLDDSYRSFQDEPNAGPYIPDSSVMARLTLNF